MSSDEWNAAIDPKIQGTWNLHDASLDQDLDFFLLFSSMGGILGIPGQANYASANNLHGCSKVLGMSAILNRLKLLECARMSQKDLFHAITVAISHSLPPQTLDYSRYENPAQFITGIRDTTGMLDSTGGKSMLLDSRLAAYVGNSVAVTAPTERRKLRRTDSTISCLQLPQTLPFFQNPRRRNLLAWRSQDGYSTFS
ncbi:hypothetical protein DTO271G3_7430 [Paecilomyces variotii]|nr:hypothetical protein DTO271G3_7430 [Paecilomyces variotii]